VYVGYNDEMYKELFGWIGKACFHQMLIWARLMWKIS
jgi:hypothetical protein